MLSAVCFVYVSVFVVFFVFQFWLFCLCLFTPHHLIMLIAPLSMSNTSMPHCVLKWSVTFWYITYRFESLHTTEDSSVECQRHVPECMLTLSDTVSIKGVNVEYIALIASIRISARPLQGAIVYIAIIHEFAKPEVTRANQEKFPLWLWAHKFFFSVRSRDLRFTYFTLRLLCIIRINVIFRDISSILSPTIDP